MKIIRISTDLELSVHEFPCGSYKQQNQELRDLIGGYCNIYEHVMPKRLYTELHQENRPTKIAGQCVSMLVDEEGRLKADIEPNPLASYLYETEKHGTPIMGNVLFVGEKLGRDGIEFCGIRDSVFRVLEKQLHDIVSKMKEELGI